MMPIGQDLLVRRRGEGRTGAVAMDVALRCGACGHALEPGPDAARDPEHLAASFVVMPCGDEHTGPLREGRVKWSSVKQGIDGEAEQIVCQDHVRAASRWADRAGQG